MKNPQRGFVVPLIMVIAIFIVIGGGAYLYNKNKTNTISVNSADKILSKGSVGTVNPTVSQTSSNIITPTPTPTSTPIKNPVKNSSQSTPQLNTYTQVHNLYSFKYPAGSIINSEKVVAMSDDGTVLIPIPDGKNPLRYTTINGPKLSYEPAVSIQLVESSPKPYATLIFFFEQNNRFTQNLQTSNKAVKKLFGTINDVTVDKYLQSQSPNNGQEIFVFHLGQFGTSTENLVIISDASSTPSISKNVDRVENFIRSVIPNVAGMNSYLRASGSIK